MLPGWGLSIICFRIFSSHSPQWSSLTCWLSFSLLLNWKVGVVRRLGSEGYLLLLQRPWLWFPCQVVHSHLQLQLQGIHCPLLASGYHIPRQPARFRHVIFNSFAWQIWTVFNMVGAILDTSFVSFWSRVSCSQGWLHTHCVEDDLSIQSSCLYPPL